MPVEDTAKQIPEDGVQEPATQTVEDSAQPQVDNASAPATKTDQDGADRVEEGLKQAAIEERKKRQEIEAQLAAKEAELAYYRQNQAIQQPQQPENTYALALKEMGLDDRDFLTERERIEVLNRKERLDQQKNQQQRIFEDNANFIREHPDYSEVVGTSIGQSFIPSSELNALLTKKPYLLQAATSGARAAYELVMYERQVNELAKTQTVNNERDARQKVDALTSPMSPSTTGGGVTGVSYKTREDVAAMEARVAAGEFD